jgi:hypothetical protein
MPASRTLDRSSVAMIHRPGLIFFGRVMVAPAYP